MQRVLREFSFIAIRLDGSSIPHRIVHSTQGRREAATVDRPAAGLQPVVHELLGWKPIPLWKTVWKPIPIWKPTARWRTVWKAVALQGAGTTGQATQPRRPLLSTRREAGSEAAVLYW